MKITQEIQNKLLKRKEIQFTITSEKNPGYENSKRFLVEKLKVPEENVAIKFVKNNYGTSEFKVEAFVYESREQKERIEPKQKAKNPGAKS